MSLVFRFCDLEISLSSFNSLNLFLQFLFYFAWLSTSVGAILCLHPKTPYSMTLVETLSYQILELLKLIVFCWSISERFVPKSQCRAPSLLSWQDIHVSQSTDPLIVTFVAGLQTFLSNVSLTWCSTIPYTSQDYALTETNSTTTLLYSTFRPQLCTLQHDCFNVPCSLRNNVVINEKLILQEKYLMYDICFYFKVG